MFTERPEMEFRVLGNFEIIDHEELIPIGGIYPKATLAFLLLHSNSIVPVSGILKALWPSDQPATGRKMLHNAVSRLRGILAENEIGEESTFLLTHSPGYFLRVPSGNLDLTRFRSQAAAGHAQLLATDWEEAAVTLRGALDLWRGPALLDLTEAGMVWPEIDALENARLDVLEDWAEALLAMGSYAEVIREVEAHGGTNFARERMTAQLMQALYHAGRQSDALGVYQHTRTSLIEQFGLDPSPVLRDLERAILHHDLPSLPPFSAATSEKKGDPRTGSHPVVSLDGPQRAGSGEDPGAVVVDLHPESPHANDRVQMAVAVVLALPRAAESDGDESLEDHVEDVVRTETLRSGSLVAGNLGALWLITSWAGATDPPAAQRMMRCVTAIRDRLRASVPGRAGLKVKAAVTAGDAQLCAVSGSGAPRIPGSSVNRALRMLDHAEPDAIILCDESVVGAVEWMDGQPAQCPTEDRPMVPAARTTGSAHGNDGFQRGPELRAQHLAGGRPLYLLERHDAVGQERLGEVCP